MSDMSLFDVVPGLSESGRPRRSDERNKQRRRKKRRRRTALVVLVAVLLIGGGVAAAFAGLAPVVANLREPDDFTGAGSGTVQVEIHQGDTGRAIGRTLLAAGVVKTVKGFVEVAAADPKAAGIQPGIYNVRKKMSSAAAIALLADPAERVVIKVTIPEGRRLSQILVQLSTALGIPLADLTAASKNAAAIGLPAAAKGKAEGYLFPSTYEFRPDTTAVSALKAMVARNAKALADAGVPASAIAEIMTKASLVQAEGRLPEDFGKIARVFDNRLAIGMQLQSDATVSYATGRFGVTTTLAERKTPSPYNTYYVKALPAGPICSPGAAAVAAAMNPTPGPWLFFVAVNPTTGETKFSVTKAEHDRNALELQAWLKAHP